MNEDGSKGELIGETSDSGYLYISTIPTSKKIVIEKEHYFPSVQTLSSTPGSASYFFLTEDTGIVTVEEGTTSTSSNGRILGRSSKLNLSTPKLYMSSNGAIYIPQGSSATGTISIVPASLQSFPDYQTISDKLQEPDYKTSVIGNLFVLSSAGGSFGYNNTFEQLLRFSTVAGAGSYSDIELIMGVSLSDELKAKLVDENDNITQSTIDKFKSNIELWIYKNGVWTKDKNFDLKIPDVSALSSDESKFIQKYGADGIITLNGDIYNGAYPVVAIYKEMSISEIQPNELTLNVCVVDSESNESLNQSLVELSMPSRNLDVFKEINSSTGYAQFKILAEEGFGEDITLNVIEGNHYPITKVLNTNSLNQPVGDNNHSATTTLCYGGDGDPIKMITPPKKATVQGYVYDQTGMGIANANVKLVAPIALSTVKKDVVKTINNRQVKGIEVAPIPNAKYRWFIKKHRDEVATSNQPVGNGRILGRVSEKRWLLLKEGTTKSGANFLGYDEILNMAIKSPKDSDPSDVKIVASGQFDIAIEVQHDIDGDGVGDFYELAKSPTIAPNLPKEQFYPNPDSEYSQIGYISTVIDIEKLYFDLGDKVITEAGFLVKTPSFNSGNWFKVDLASGFTLTKEANTTLQNLGIVDLDNFLEDPELNNGNNLNYINYLTNSVKILGNKKRGYLKIKEKNTNRDNYTYVGTAWDLVIQSYIALQGGDGAYVALQVQSDGSLKWVATDGNIQLDSDKLANGIRVQKSESNKLLLNKVARLISSNRLLEKLAMPISEIQAEAGFTGTPLSPNNTLFDDGFTIFFVPTVKLKTIDNQDMLVRLKTEMDLSGVKLRKYIKLSKVFVDKPTLTPPVQYDVTDRVGLYHFSAVDMDFGQLKDTNNSLVRVSAQKLGYFNSPAINVPKFGVDDPNTTPREDVKNIDITLKEKPTYSVSFNITNENGEPVENAIVSIDGIKTEQNLREFESVATIQGATGKFT
ncbi:MAG TPA: hypothetical protein EYO61_02835, partial [Campylobacterales bacterium]|nr:hypothetical protein [Campylobacterales bacterium]